MYGQETSLQLMAVEVLVVTLINHKVTGILLVVDIVRFTLEVVTMLRLQETLVAVVLTITGLQILILT